MYGAQLLISNQREFEQSFAQIMVMIMAMYKVLSNALGDMYVWGSLIVVGEKAKNCVEVVQIFESVHVSCKSL